jgi:type III secretion system low calcium response chaperone LcrH/SycD
MPDQTLNLHSLLSDEEAQKFYAYGYAHYNNGSLQEALAAFRCLTMRRPFEERFWFGLAATLQGLKEFEKAVDVWAIASLLDKTSSYPHFHAAECLFSLGKNQEGFDALSAAEKLTQDDNGLIQKISALKGNRACQV